MSSTDGGEILDYHRSMLADTERTEAYRRAIGEIVRPGDVVLDLGTGSGVLASFAALAGARRVFAVERGPVADLACMVVSANGLADRVEVIRGDSREIDLPEPADVLITETLWNLGLGEGILGSVLDARERHLREGARIVPESIDLIAAPVESREAYEKVEFWSQRRYGLDFSTVRSFAANNCLRLSMGEASLVAAPACLARVPLDEAMSTDVEGRVVVRAHRAATVHAIAGWFYAELSERVSLTNAPPIRTPNWAHAVFPLEQPQEVNPGEQLTLNLRSTANGSAWIWSLETESTSAANFSSSAQSTLWGFPPNGRELERRASSHRPLRSPRGDAAAAILTNVDGRQTIDSLAADVHERFPAAFRSPTDAEEFVRTLVVSYCQEPSVSS